VGFVTASLFDKTLAFSSEALDYAKEFGAGQQPSKRI
jgi:hypothetical protein